MTRGVRDQDGRLALDDEAGQPQRGGALVRKRLEPRAGRGGEPQRVARGVVDVHGGQRPRRDRAGGVGDALHHSLGVERRGDGLADADEIAHPLRAPHRLGVGAGVLQGHARERRQRGDDLLILLGRQRPLAAGHGEHAEQVLARLDGHREQRREARARDPVTGDQASVAPDVGDEDPAAALGDAAADALAIGERRGDTDLAGAAGLDADRARLDDAGLGVGRPHDGHGRADEARRGFRDAREHHREVQR